MRCFHLIGFPSEWGQWHTIRGFFCVMVFPFNWFPQRVGTEFATAYQERCYRSFHLIGFPSEWGRVILAAAHHITLVLVSI